MGAPGSIVVTEKVAFMGERGIIAPNLLEVDTFQSHVRSRIEGCPLASTRQLRATKSRRLDGVERLPGGAS